MARPRKEATEHRSIHIGFRLSPMEHQRFIAAAENAGRSPSSYARDMALNGRVTVVQGRGVSPMLYTALTRIGINLNQLARASNEGRGVDHIALMETLTTLNTILTENIGHEPPRG